MGYRILITEFDVNDIGTPSSSSSRDNAVADVYKRILNVALDEPATCALVTWGLSDGDSWYNKGDNRSNIRGDGTPQRPLLFDPDFKPKPALQALVDALSHAPTRPLPPKA